MTNTGAILTLKKPVSTLKKPIEFNSKSFFINATKAIAKGATLDFSGAGESALDILADAGLRNKPNKVAWVLIYQSLMLAVAELVQDSNDLFINPPSDEQKGALGACPRIERELRGKWPNPDFPQPCFHSRTGS